MNVGYAAELYIPFDPNMVREDGKIGLTIEFHDDTNANNGTDAYFTVTGRGDYWNCYEELPEYVLK